MQAPSTPTGTGPDAAVRTLACSTVPTPPRKAEARVQGAPSAVDQASSPACQRRDDGSRPAPRNDQRRDDRQDRAYREQGAGKDPNDREEAACRRFIACRVDTP